MELVYTTEVDPMPQMIRCLGTTKNERLRQANGGAAWNSVCTCVYHASSRCSCLLAILNILMDDKQFINLVLQHIAS